MVVVFFNHNMVQMAVCSDCAGVIFFFQKKKRQNSANEIWEPNKSSSFLANCIRNVAKCNDGRGFSQICKTIFQMGVKCPNGLVMWGVNLFAGATLPLPKSMPTDEP